MDWYLLFWLIVFVTLLVAEGLTMGLIGIWFALGALVAFIAGLFDASLWVQVVLFLSVAAVTLILTRPLCKRYIDSRKQNLRTNADRNIGALGKCTEPINNEEATGAVYIYGKEWTARSADGTAIAKDATVMVEAIDGVKLLVRLAEHEPSVSIPRQ